MQSILSRKKLNEMLNGTNKVLELVFNFYLGLIVHWFHIVEKNGGSENEVTKEVERYASGNATLLARMGTEEFVRNKT